MAIVQCFGDHTAVKLLRGAAVRLLRGSTATRGSGGTYAGSMAHTCAHCGRPCGSTHRFGSGNRRSETDAGVELLFDDATTDSGPQFTAPNQPTSDSRLLRWVAGAIAAWLLVSLAIGIARSGDPDAVAVQASPTPAPTAVPTPTPDLTLIEASSAATSPETGSGETAPEETPATDAAGSAVPSAEAHDTPGADDDDATQPAGVRAADTGPSRGGSLMLQRQIQRRDVTVSLAYGTETGIAIVALDTMDVQEIEALAGPVDVDPGTLVLARNGNPLLVDPAGPAVTRVDVDGELVINTETGASALFRDGSPATAITLAGTQTAWDPVDGARLVPLEGFGIIAVADEQEGPTRRLTPQGFEPFSKYPVVTANPAGRVEARCESPVSCATMIVERDGQEWEVDSEFLRLGDSAYLAPNGSTLLRVTPTGYAEMYAPDKGWTAWVIGAGMQDPVWAPDSSFIAWLDMDAGPALKVMFPDTRDWIRVPLDDIGAPLPITAELIIF